MGGGAWGGGWGSEEAAGLLPCFFSDLDQGRSGGLLSLLLGAAGYLYTQNSGISPVAEMRLSISQMVAL